MLNWPTLDWFVVLTPLALLPIALLFIFVGCKPFGTADAPPTPPPTPPPTGSGPPPPPPPPTPPPPPPTRVQLNPALDLNVIKPGGTDYKVVSIQVTWTLSKQGSGPPPKALQDSISGTNLAHPFLDPAVDGSVIRDLTPLEVATYDRVRCECTVTLRPTDLTDPDTDTFKTVAVQAPLAANKNHVFRLDPNWNNLKAKPRRFTVIQEF